MLSLSWVDYLIIAIFAIYAYGGYSSGFIRTFFDLIGSVFSFLIGLSLYGYVAGILMDKFSMPQGLSNAAGFFIIVFLAQIILKVIVLNFLSFEIETFKNLNKIFGIIPGILSGAILISFILILFLAFPTSAPIKNSVSSSKIGNYLLLATQSWEESLNNVFNGAINETINFLTVEPKSNEIVSLNFKAKSVVPDPLSEKEMFNLVNKERILRGLKGVDFDTDLRDVGRSHCEDMLKRGFFSHNTPEGDTPFDRMDEAGVIYNSAGENLALSPDVNIAMQGLMKSPGHKANILSINFGRVGVGVIDGGIYGKMFCQEFAD